MSIHDRIDTIRELLALERAVAIAPDSARVRSAYEGAWSAAFESCCDDQYESLSNDVANAMTNMPCETCGGIGYVKDDQLHAGSHIAEPIVSPCVDCCNACHGSGRRIITETQHVPVFSDDDDWTVTTEIQEIKHAVYCECRFGDRQRERDERRSL